MVGWVAFEVSLFSLNRLQCDSQGLFFYLIAILALRVKSHSLQERSVPGNVLSVDHHVKNIIYISTWSYENRVSKHFVISLNFPCLTACLLCCLLMSIFTCFVVRGLSRSGCRQNYYLIPLHPSLFFVVPTHNSLFNTSDSYLKSARA